MVEALNNNLTNFGFVVAGVFAAGWILSVFLYRLNGFENKA
jgi:high-affinity nickel permease